MSSPAGFTIAFSAARKSPRARRSARSCSRLHEVMSIRRSHLHSCCQNGPRSSMHGSSIPGRRTVLWPVSVGRRRLPEKQRQALWAIFERVRGALKERRLVTRGGALRSACRPLHEGREVALRLRGGRRGAGRERGAASLRRRPQAATGPRPCSSPAIWGSGSSRCRSPGESLGVDIRGRSAHAAHQLSDFSPDQGSGRSPPREANHRR